MVRVSLTCALGLLTLGAAGCRPTPDPTAADRPAPVAFAGLPAPTGVVTGMPGCVAVWDFGKRETGEPRK